MQLAGYGLTPSDLGFEVPGDKFRSNQLELAESIVNSNKKIICLIGPTGIGKSLIVQIPGRVLDQRTLILTRTIQLQDQYGEQGLPVLMGRNRYLCNRWPEVSAAEAVCRMGVKCGLRWSGECDYYNEKDNAVHAETSVLNYAVFFKFIGSTDAFSGWDWLVLDEAHNAATELSTAFTIKLSLKDLRKFNITPPMFNTMEYWRLWAGPAHKKVKNLLNRRDLQSVTKPDLLPLYNIMAACDLLLLTETSNNWVIKKDKSNITISPIWPTELASKGIWDHGQKFILSSATLEPYMIANMLGVSESDMEIVQVGSNFPIENRPINVLGHHRVTHASSEQDIVGLVKDIDRVVTRYEGQRGLIHTGNYALALRIAELSTQSHRLLYHDSLNRLDIFEQFKAEEDKVLLSPAMVEGVDLPYDMCRFQIVAKVPFQDLTSDLWKARFNDDIMRARLAYSGDAINAIVQACGRGMRAPDDKCDTWVLDRAFDRVRAESNYRFPPFFTEAVRYMDRVND